MALKFDPMQPTFFINHGGGPCFFLEPGAMREAWKSLELNLRNFASRLAEPPRAVLMVSGHWVTAQPTVNSAVAPSLLFDYQGFPPDTYRLTWPAPGSPSLAARVQALLGDAGIASAQDPHRGWDHGVFVPMKVMYPKADIPLMQLSLQRGFSPQAHLAIGHALRPLRGEGVLIVGSGQSFHNMRGMLSAARRDDVAEAFDDWLRSAMQYVDARDSELAAWAEAPGARHAHPYEDHLIPLMVAAGAASGELAQLDFYGYVLGKPISGFRFG